ncbi:MAG: hypothetical protein LBQ36_10080, partial [Synergistaceae bacterium]|nr:hypothetical protein [Synergistaceae bacterium]
MSCVTRGQPASGRAAIIVLSAVCAVMLVAMVLLISYDPREGADGLASPPEVFEITSLSASEVGAVAVSNSAASYGLLNDPSGIRVVSGASGDYSASELRAFVYAACHLSGTREIKDLS